MTTDIKQLRGTERLIRLDCLFDGNPGCVCSHCEASDTIARLAAERDRLKEAIERNAQNCIDTMNKMHAQHAAERDRLKAALEFYADENNWRDQPFLRMDHLGRECEDYSPAEMWGDDGDRARKALGGAS